MSTIDLPRTRSPARLWAEFLLFFAVAPLILAILLPPDRMFPLLFLMTAVGIVLLHLTPTFRWRDLLDGVDRIEWWKVGGIGLLVLLSGTGLLWLTRPEALFGILRHQPMLMLMIFLLYPLVSALPQEVVYRALFFRRYQLILPRKPGAMILLNAALFSMAHLMYWSWVVLVMTFLGGIAFAWAYEVRRSFPMAVLLHAVAGNVIFLVGLGIHFYSGNVVRPF